MTSPFLASNIASILFRLRALLTGSVVVGETTPTGRSGDLGRVGVRRSRVAVVGVAILVFGADTAVAQFPGYDIEQLIPDDTLIQYSVYGSKYVRLPTSQSGTATSGLFGSGGNMYLSSGSTVRSSRMTIAGDLVLETGVRFDTSSRTKIAVGGNFTINGNIASGWIFRDTVQVGGNMSINAQFPLWQNLSGNILSPDLFVTNAFSMSGNDVSFGYIRAGSVSQTGTNPIWNDSVLVSGTTTAFTTSPGGLLRTNAGVVPSPLGIPPVIVSARLPGYTIPWLPDPGDEIPLSPIFATRSNVSMKRTGSKLDDTILQSVVRCSTLVNTTLHPEACKGDTLQPGDYGVLNLDGDQLVLGQGFFSFSSINLSNGASLVSTHPTGDMTVVNVRGTYDQNSGSPSHVGPADALGVKRYGSDSGAFLGGSFLLVVGGDVRGQVANFNGSDNSIWATISVPGGKANFNSQIKLFGQVFADTINGQNNLDFGTGAFVPIRPPRVITINKNLPITIREHNPGQSTSFRDTTILVTIDYVSAFSIQVDWTYQNITATANQDYLGSPPAVNSGTVTIPAGQLSAAIPLRINDDNFYEGDETFRIILSNPKYAILPDSAVADTIGVTILDDENPPTLAFQATSSQGLESVASPVLNVRLSSASDSIVTVEVHVKGGTATRGGAFSDYSMTSPISLTFPAGTTSVQVPFTVLDDHRYEPNETISLVLRGPTGPAALSLLADTASIYTILDNDPRPVVRIRDTTVSEGPAGVRVAQGVEIYLADSVSGARIVSTDSVSGFDVPFGWSTIDGTAFASLPNDTDYTSRSGIPDTLKAGQSSKIVIVTIHGDDHLENAESFLVRLRNLTNVALSDSLDTTGVVTITNDDALPRIRIYADSIQEPDRGDTVLLSQVVRLVDTSGIALSAQSAPKISVGYTWSTANATAVAPGDYIAVGPAVAATIPAGGFQDTLQIRVVGDDRFEGDEYFTTTIVPGVLLVGSSPSVLSASGSILDNELTPGLCIADTSVSEAVTPARVRVFLASGNCFAPLTSIQAPEVPVRFSWATSDSSAKQPGDYAARSGTDTIPVGSLSRLLSVPIVNDNVWEGTEVFKISLSGLVNGVGLKTLARVTIQDNESEPTVVVSPVTRDEGDSGSTTFPFIVRLSHRSELPVVFTWSTISIAAPDSASSLDDLDPVPTRTDSVRVLQDSTILNVFVNGDTKRENNESFAVRITPVTGITSAGSTLTATGTIVNDDAEPSLLEIEPVAADEGDFGTKIFRFKLILSAASGLPTSFTWSALGWGVSGDSLAVVGEDFIGVTDSLVTIPAESTSIFLDVQVRGDTKFERSERFRVLATPNSGLSGSAVQTIGTIINDDLAPVVSILDAPAVNEPVATGASTNASFRIRLSSPSGIPVSVDWATVDSSARSGSGDYTHSFGTAAFAPGDTSLTITVPVLGDNFDEPTEYFRVILSNANEATGIPDTAIGSINDTDPPPGIFVDDIAVDEPIVPGDTALVSVTIRLERRSELPVSFSWTTRDSSALDGDLDYDSTGGGTSVRFPAGTTTITIPVFVTVRGDNVANEGNETFRLVVRNLSNAAVGDTSGTVTIRDRTPAPSLSIAASDTVDEANLDIPLTISMNRPSATNVRVLVRTHAVTATAGSDFRADSTWVTITAGSTSTTVYSTRVLEDNRYEDSIQTYEVRIDSAVGATGKPRVTIGIRDDEPVPTLSVTGTSVTEPANAPSTVAAISTVTLSGPSELPITVAWATDTSVVSGVVRALPSDDYVAGGNTLTFPADTLVQRFTVLVNADSLDEFLEAFVVRLSAPTVATILKDTGVIVIQDEDAAPTLSVDDPAAVGEGGLVNFTARLQRASAKDVRFVWTTFDGTATAGADYTSRTAIVVTIPAGQRTATLPVTTLADVLAGEGTEDFRVRLDSISNAAVGDTTGTGLIAEATGIPVLSIDSVGAFREPGADSSVVFKVSLSTPSAVDVRVSFRTVAGTATLGEDLVDTTGTVLITAGVTSIDLPIRIFGDAFDEIDEETFHVELFAPESASIIQNIGTGSILDEDAAPSISVLDDSLLEPANAGDHDTLLVRVSLSAPSKREVRVGIQLEDSSAVSPADYDRSGTTLVFAPESTLVHFKVAIAGDSLDEFLEAFRTLLSSPVNAVLGDSTGFVAILDADAEPTLSLVGTTAREGDTALVTVLLERPSAKTVVFDWTTVEGTATSNLDYQANSRTDTITAGATTLTLRIPVFADSIANEFSEQFRILLTRVVNAATSDSDAVVVIDDQTPAPRLSIFAADTVVEDPVNLVFAIRLDRPSAVSVRVGWKSLEGTATAGLDFSDTTGVLVIPAMATSATVSVRVLEDNLYEPWVESLQVVLSAPESAAIAIDRAPGYIVDDNDNPPVVIDSSRSVTEGGSARFPVRLLNVSADTVKVWVRHVNGTALSGQDFEATSRVVIFLPGDTVQNVAVATFVDSLWEPTESFALRIDSVQGGFVADGEDSLGQVLLLEEGPVPTLEFASPDTSVVEAVAGLVPVRVRLSRPASIDLQIGLSIDSATKAAFGTDFTLRDLVGDTLTIPALTRGSIFRIEVLDDSLDEFDELVRLRLRNLGQTAAVGKTSLDLTILDDDEPPQIVFSVDSQVVDESVGTVTVTARLSRPSGKIIDVWYSVSGTSTPGGVDHDMAPFHFTFRTGFDTSKVTFQVNDDVLDEPDETVVVLLDSTVNGNLAAGQKQIVLIRDNDGSPKARFGDTLFTVLENVGTVSFPILLDHPSSSEVVVRIRVGGSARADSLRSGSDVVLDSTVEYEIRIPAGDTSATFVVTVIGDGRVETTEQLRLVLRGGPGADPDAVSNARLVILDDDRIPDVKITGPKDSLWTKDPNQVITWTWDGRPQTPTDTTLVENRNVITRCATDTAGNTGCDTIHVWGDFTPPVVTIKVPVDSLHLTNKPDVRVCWTVLDSGATWRRLDSTCIDTTLSEGKHIIVRTACDEVGNCGTDQVIVTVDLTPPTGVFVFPPDSARIRVDKQPALIRWIDDKDTIWVRDTLDMKNYGWNTFTATYTDKAGNTGTTQVHLYFEAPQVQGGWYVDTDGDGKVDAAIVEFDSPWLSDSVPSFSFELGAETRTEIAPKGWYSQGTRGTPALDNSGRVIVDAKGETVYVLPGIPMLDKTGKPVLDSLTGKVLTSPVGTVWRDADGKPVYDASGRELYRVPGPGTEDHTRMVVPLVTPFKYGVTSLDSNDLGRISVILPLVDSTGSVVKKPLESDFAMRDSVAPIISKAVVHRTETYSKDGGRDTLYITPSEKIVLDSTGRWLEIKIDGKWVTVHPESLFVAEDGRIGLLIPPADSASPDPGVQVRFLEGVTDSAGNANRKTTKSWSTVVEGKPRPPLLRLSLPTPVKSVPAEERAVTRPGGFVLRATDRRDTSQYQWWKPGYGYTTGTDPDIASVCPDLRFCNGVEMYVNRPVRMLLFVYDLSGTYVVNQEIDITAEDIASLRADELDRVRIQLQWNMRSKAGAVVGSGVYLWRIISWVGQIDGTAPVMTNQVVKVGVKSMLE